MSENINPQNRKLSFSEVVKGVQLPISSRPGEVLKNSVQEILPR